MEIGGGKCSRWSVDDCFGVVVLRRWKSVSLGGKRSVKIDRCSHEIAIVMLTV